MKIEIEVRDDKLDSVLRTLENIKYVKVLNKNGHSSEKEKILKGLAEAVEEVKLHRAGKIKLKTARQLLNDL